MQLLAALALAAQTVTAPAHPPELRGEDLMTALRSGGYTILLRHARTDYSGAKESPGTIPPERSMQRNLSGDGIRDAKLMGLVLKKYHIPIGEIIASPMFRARETAEMAAGTPSIDMALRSFPSTPEQAALVAVAPKAGTNRLLVTHHFVIEAHAPGIHPGEINESEGVVLRPAADGALTLIGRITLGDWEQLGGVATKTMEPKPTPAISAETTYATRGTNSGHAPLAAIPTTRAGRLADRYLAAYNSGDVAKMRAFIESSLVPDEKRPTDARIETYQKTLADRGPFTFSSVRQSSEDEIMVDVRDKSGNNLVLVVKAVGDRASSIGLGTLAGGHP